MIRELPKGLVNWYGFHAGSNALFITGGFFKREAEQQGIQEDVFAEVLRDAGLVVSCMDTGEILTQKNILLQKEKYDYILLVGVLECCSEPERLLITLKGMLKAQGRLLIGADNRLGVRYFCGDRDGFTGRNFDGIENYYQISEAGSKGRKEGAYSRAEISEMLDKAGLISNRFYSVMPDLTIPQLIYAEDYLPEEELDVRYYPSYRNPDTIFLEEERLYSSLIQNGLFHGMANSYLIECSLNGELSDVKHVTISMNRERKNVLATVIRRNNTVAKKAIYQEGVEQLKELIKNNNDLREHGVPVIEARMEGDEYVMPYIHGETAIEYFRNLLVGNKEKFIAELDIFFELILQSSEHVPYAEVDWERFDPEWEIRKEDDPERDKWRRIAFSEKSDDLGVILRKGYIDLVPLNCFRVNDKFLFYDQEFCINNLPANVIFWRTIELIYGGNSQFEMILSLKELLKRYHMDEYLELWQGFTIKFSSELWNEKKLASYNQLHRRNLSIVHSNRQRMNYSENEYQRIFRDIFHNVEGKKLYLFGSGNYTKKFLSQFGEDYEIAGILDNNSNKWGMQMEGITIGSPAILRNLSPEEYKIIICIKKYIPVLNQLKELGTRNYGIYDWNLEYPRKTKIPILTDDKEDKIQKKYHTGYIAGVFDLFHIGHLNMFKRAKEQCDYLIVGVVTDESVIRRKKTSPYIPFEERIEMVRSCRYVDEAVQIPVEFGDTDEAFRRYRFDVQFSGSDYENDPEWLAKKVYLQKQGSDLVFFPYTQSTSSTKLKEMISKGLL